MNILFIGSSSLLSIIPLQALISSNYSVCAIATNEHSHSDFNVVSSGAIQSLSFTYSIPLINLNNINSDVVAELESYQPDVILVSCYAGLIPQKILSIAKIGGFNLHPSLLPIFRGPSPLFWQFREGVDDFGVSLHRMSADFDTGNIIAQKKIAMDDGVSYTDATKLLANIGSELILTFLDNTSEKKFNETVQDNALSSYQSFPTKDDYTVNTFWSAKRIYNFIKAYKETDVFFLCEVNGDEFKLVDALSYQNIAYAEMGKERYVVDGDIITLACNNSYIQCQLKLV